MPQQRGVALNQCVSFIMRIFKSLKVSWLTFCWRKWNWCDLPQRISLLWPRLRLSLRIRVVSTGSSSAAKNRKVSQFRYSFNSVWDPSRLYCLLFQLQKQRVPNGGRPVDFVGVLEPNEAPSPQLQFKNKLNNLHLPEKTRNTRISHNFLLLMLLLTFISPGKSQWDHRSSEKQR